MAIKFPCPNPNCQVRIRAEDSKAGRLVRCPQCHERLRVPAQADSTTPENAPAVTPLSEVSSDSSDSTVQASSENVPLPYDHAATDTQTGEDGSQEQQNPFGKMFASAALLFISIRPFFEGTAGGLVGIASLATSAILLLPAAWIAGKGLQGILRDARSGMPASGSRPLQSDAPVTNAWAVVSPSADHEIGEGKCVFWCVGLSGLVASASVLVSARPLDKAASYLSILPVTVFTAAIWALAVVVGTIICLTIGATLLGWACRSTTRIATVCGASDSVVREPALLRRMDILAVASLGSMPLWSVLVILAVTTPHAGEARLLLLLTLPVGSIVLAVVMTRMLSGRLFWKGFVVPAVWMAAATVYGVLAGLLLLLVTPLRIG